MSMASDLQVVLAVMLVPPPELPKTVRNSGNGFESLLLADLPQQEQRQSPCLVPALVLLHLLVLKGRRSINDLVWNNAGA